MLWAAISRADATEPRYVRVLGWSMVKEGKTDTPEFEQRTKLDHSTHNAEVGGSSPPVATSILHNYGAKFN